MFYGKTLLKWNTELDYSSIDCRVQRDAFRSVCKMKVCTCKQCHSVSLLFRFITVHKPKIKLNQMKANSGQLNVTFLFWKRP